MFVVRVAGNVVGESELATIEYGVEHLGTPVLVVLGHTGCGAVTAVVWVAVADAAPGSASPSASTRQAMVDAVPITMQVPTEGARRSFTASISPSASATAKLAK